MKDLVKTIHPTTGNASLANVVRHLRSSLRNPEFKWSPGQREAAELACSEAEELLGLVCSAVERDGWPVLYEELPQTIKPRLQLVGHIVDIPGGGIAMIPTGDAAQQSVKDGQPWR